MNKQYLVTIFDKNIIFKQFRVRGQRHEISYQLCVIEGHPRPNVWIQEIIDEDQS